MIERKASEKMWSHNTREFEASPRGKVKLDILPYFIYGFPYEDDFEYR